MKTRLSLERLIKKHEEYSGFGVVDSIYQSYYILPDGRFLGCNYDCGSRGDDHRMIFGATPLERNDWKGLHSSYKVMRFMPEGWCAWISKRQRLTEIQLEIIEEYGLEIVRY